VPPNAVAAAKVLLSERPARSGWFTEGFDTRDLKEAKALLDELATYRSSGTPTGSTISKPFAALVWTSITVVIFCWHICLISESMGHHDSEIMDDGSID
jgi:hypothetical protein